LILNELSKEPKLIAWYMQLHYLYLVSSQIVNKMSTG